MSVYLLDRRKFMKLTLAASSRSFVSNLGFAFGPAEDRTAWYRNAKFGVFIHWVPYSLASVEASWPIMRPAAGGITEVELLITETLKWWRRGESNCMLLL
jgi:alpha-L-fucosidase